MNETEGSAALAWIAPAPPVTRSCVFVDRDGVINERIVGGYVLQWSDFRWRPDAIAALRILANANLPVVVVSNQSCVGRGLLAQTDLVDMMERMRGHLESNGAPLSAWYCCPHAPDDGCDCRKPKPGMLRRGARELGLDLARSHLVGDSASDIAAGEAAGCVTHRVDPALDGGFEAAARAIASASTTR